jgi:hypothetical protein
MSPTFFKKRKHPQGDYPDKGTVIRLKLGDIKAKSKSLKNDRLVHLKRFWITKDPEDAVDFLGRSMPKTPIFPHWWLKYNSGRAEVRFKRKSLNYLHVLNSLNEYGYNPETFHNGHMKLSKNRTLIDGNHRFDLLYAKYGSEHEVDFLIVGWTQSITVLLLATIIITLYSIMFVSLVLIKLISIPYYILNKLFNFSIRNESKM